MGHDRIVEKVGDRAFAGIVAGADIERLLVDVVLEVVGVAVVDGDGGIVEAMALDRQLFERRRCPAARAPSAARWRR